MEIDFEDLGKQCLTVCDKQGWERDWREGGCYLHLEVSEFIESLRGKHGLPVEEAGDVMFVLLAMMQEANISFEQSIEYMKKRHGLI